LDKITMLNPVHSVFQTCFRAKETIFHRDTKLILNYVDSSSKHHVHKDIIQWL